MKQFKGDRDFVRAFGKELKYINLWADKCCCFCFYQVIKRMSEK